ncbi:MAG: hypothetical protein Tsb009_33140 [Planctomycetaceae bacterium]
MDTAGILIVPTGIDPIVLGHIALVYVTILVFRIHVIDPVFRRMVVVSPSQLVAGVDSIVTDSEVFEVDLAATDIK